MRWRYTVTGIEALLEERRRDEEVIRVEFEARVAGLRQDIAALERSLALALACWYREWINTHLERAYATIERYVGPRR